MLTGHMPYAFEIDGKPWLLFCHGVPRFGWFGGAYPYMSWSICARPLDGGDSVRIQTGFSPIDIECNPTAYVENGVIHITFVGSRVIEEEPHNYALYEMTGLDLEHMSNAEPLDMMGHLTFNGFDNGRYRVVFHKNIITVFEFDKKEMHRITVDCDHVMRVAPHHAIKDVFLVTVQTGTGFKTLVYGFPNDHVYGEVLADDFPVYKSTIYGSKVYHALRGDDEHRTITSGICDIVQSDIVFTKRAKEWKRLGYVVPDYRLAERRGIEASPDLEYSGRFDRVMALSGKDDVTKWVQAMASQNNLQRCSARRKAKLKYYIDEAIKQGLSWPKE